MESSIATESHSETCAIVGVTVSPNSIRSTSSQRWSTDVDGGERRPYGDAVPEFNIWGISGASAPETGNSIWNTGSGSLWQHISSEGLSGMKKPEVVSGELAWHSAPVMSESNGSSESLGLSDLRQETKPWYGGLGFGSNSVESNSFMPFSGGGDGWGMPTSTAAESKSSDWGINKDNTSKSDQSSGWPSGTSENEKEQQSTWPGSDLNGAHARSSSAVFDSSAGKEAENRQLVSTSLSGNLDPSSSSTPQPEPTAEELLIAKMINSNEGWGTRPVRQDTPWTIEPSSPSAAAAVGNVTENVGGAEAGSVWNSPADAADAGQYWGGRPAEWNSDSNIGVWNDQSSTGAVNPNMWTGHAGTAAGWSGPGIGANSAGRINSGDLATALAAAGGWPDSVGSLPATIMNKLAINAANSSLDKSQPTDAQWIAALAKAQSGGGWASDPIPGTWSAADAHDPAGALIRAQLGAQPARLGPQFEVRPPAAGLKIDTWNEPPAVPDTLHHPGHWGQPPVNTQGAGMAGQAHLEAQLQQLLKLGMKREDAIQKLAAIDSVNLSRPGTSLGDAIPLQKGRMLRGQSVGDATADNTALLSQLASLQQLGGKMAHPQAVFNSANSAIGHRKQLSGSGGAGWPTQALPTGGIVGQQVQNQVVLLQSLLQPKLQYRSRIQQDRMMTQQQKRQQLDTVNAEIAALKQQIDLLQVTSGPLPPAVPPIHGQAITELLRSLASPNDATLAQQLLSQLKLEQAVPDADAKGNPMDGMTGPAEAWPGALSPPASRFPWPDNSGVRQMPPPGLGQDASAGDSAMWGRSGSGWNAGNDKFKAAAGAGGGVVGSSPTWLLLNKFTYPVEGQRIQSFCLQQGLLQTFFFNKSAGQALACFVNRDDAISARAALGTFPFADSPHPLCYADIVTSDAAKSLLSSGLWTQLSTAVGLSSVAPPPPKGRSSSTWSTSDGM